MLASTPGNQLLTVHIGEGNRKQGAFPMKIAVFGSGAIGSYLGWLLHHTAEEVTLIGRGAHLAAMQANGLKLRAAGPDKPAVVRAVTPDTPLPPQDLVLLCVKAHSLPAATPHIAPLIGPQTTVLTVVNGIPWWYAHHAPVTLAGDHLQGVDPAGAVWRTVGPEKAIGCVPYVGVSIPEPGVVELSVDGYNEFPIGEPSGQITPRLAQLKELFTAAGITTSVTTDIRALIWKKLLGNITTNPISVITNATMRQMLAHPETIGLMRAMMEETLAIARAVGVTFEVSLDERIGVMRKLGDFKTSMLQDFEQGRALEIGPIVGAPLELAQQAGVAAPHLETVCHLVSAIAQRHNLTLSKAA